MNRKIRTIDQNFSRSQHYSIDGKPSVELYYDTHTFIREKNIQKFARRNFSGASRIEFTLESDWSRTPVFIAYDDDFVDGEIRLCEKRARRVLGLGKRTKKFSLWVKTAKPLDN